MNQPQMRVVIDTNCLLSCIGKKSPYRNVFDLFLSNNLVFSASTEILLEYEESFARFWGADVTRNLMGLFETRENFQHVVVYYNWQLINSDEDDNKFIDAYIASKSDYLISNDSAIVSLKGNSFPPLNIMTLQEFSKNINQ